MTTEETDYEDENEATEKDNAEMTTEGTDITR